MGVDAYAWMDYECPYNPRGRNTNQQHPSGSSTGSAVAVAAYDWCDFALGTDTGGSMRAPGGANGVYANRFSTGTVSCHGVWCVAQRLDALGVFARDPQLLALVCRVLLPPSPSPFLSPPPPRPVTTTTTTTTATATTSPPRCRLLYPTDARFRWAQEGQVAEVLEAAVKGIERVLGCRRTVCRVEELWAMDSAATLDEATGRIYSILAATGTLSSPDLASFLPTDPPMEDAVRRRLEWARGLSPADDVADAVSRLETFRSWVAGVLLPPSAAGDDDVVMVFPQTLGAPVLRSDHQQRIIWDGFSIYAIGYAAGCAEVVVPVGEASDSGLPVCLSLVARPGGDGRLLALLSGLVTCGVVRAVRPGRSMF